MCHVRRFTTGPDAKVNIEKYPAVVEEQLHSVAVDAAVEEKSANEPVPAEVGVATPRVSCAKEMERGK